MLAAIRDDLYGFTGSQSIINTHAHFYPFPMQQPSLKWVLENSYAAWRKVSIDNHEEYIRRLSANSYFFWLSKALSELTGIDRPLSPDNWTAYEEAVETAMRSESGQYDVLKNKCGYTRIVEDAAWNPGDDLGRRDLFKPSYRISMYLFGYNADAADYNGTSPYNVHGWSICGSIDEYISRMENEIIAKKDAGCVALKCAAAYDPGVDFAQASKLMAEKAMKSKEPSGEEIKAFQDYVFGEACRIAAEQNIPMQIHTGLGLTYRSNAVWLRNCVVQHPDTVFSLMHGSYPWTDDLLAMIHNYSNVVADICWLPLLSPSCSVRFIKEFVDIGDMDKITWGCDTFHRYESYAAVLALRQVLAEAFSDMIENQRMDSEYAKLYIEHILRKNAESIYHL